jgi:hypothetical protein
VRGWHSKSDLRSEGFADLNIPQIGTIPEISLVGCRH